MTRAHFTIEENQQVMMVRPVGAWGEQTAKEFVDSVNQYLTSGKANFAGIIDLRQWELGTPEALALIGQNISKAAELGYQFEIHFGQPKSIPVQISGQQVTPKEITLSQCATFDEVIQLLNEQTYSFDPDKLAAFLA